MTRFYREGLFYHENHRSLEGLVVQEGLVILLLDLVPVGLVQVPLDSVPVGVAPNSVVLVDQGFMARVGS